MATIVRTPSDTWKAVIRKQGWPTTAKTFRTQRDAKDWARRTEDEMVRGVYIERGASERLTLAVALERYLSEVTPTKKPATQQTEIERAKPLRAFFGKYSLAAITPDLVARYRDERLVTPLQPAAKSKGAPPRLLSASTVRLELALLGHLFTTAIREWRLGLAQNPVALVRKPKPAEGRNRRLSEAEEHALMAAVDAHSNPMLEWIVRIAVETGMRSGEILGLHRAQVDIKRRIVRLSDTKNDSARTVPLTRAATKVFQEVLAYSLRPRDCSLLFFGEPGRDGQRHPYNYKKVWNGIKKDLGLADLHFHDLRHEAVSRLVEAGLSDQEVSAISGHKSMQMLKRYTHLRAEDLVGKLDQVVRRERFTTT
ncbi:site-specific integrase [Frateuria defendens]|uniref:site-specific integrase n=1 Tax=Frateuria defendens TaxID=2219559 RepID=UPI00066FDD2F|nr:site-specific integrase [Frateuria defendens]